MNTHILLLEEDRAKAISVETTGTQIGIRSGRNFATPLTLHLLGDFRLACEGMTVMNIDLPRQQSLLAYLVLHRHAPQARSRLAYLFWPDSTDDQARTNLRNLLFKLREAIPGVDQLLHIDRYTLQWRSNAPWTLDVLEFERAVARADQAEQEEDHTALRLALEQAVELYRGDLLPVCYDEWILPTRDRLYQLFLGALERLLRLLDQEGSYQEAIHVAQRLLRLDSLHEEAYCHLMRLYIASGNRAAALRTYRTCVTVLERELATEPSTATRKVYERCVQMEEAWTLSPSPRLPFVRRDQNRWVKVSPKRWMETGKRASKSKCRSSSSSPKAVSGISQFV